MNNFYRSTILCCLMIFTTHVFGQRALVSSQQQQLLNNVAQAADTSFKKGYQRAVSQAKAKGWTIRRRSGDGGFAELRGLDNLGFPRYLTTFGNTPTSATTGTNQVQPGGATGLNLSGSSSFLANRLAVWDAGWVLAAHQEFAGKSILLRDTSSVADHATHVAGVMVAKGVNPQAQGMAFNMGSLLSYSFNNDVAEMNRAASGLLISNHSYGDFAGWDYNTPSARWEWYGLPGDSVDYAFGFYDTRAQAWDRIAYNAPYYLMVVASGNSRGLTGPAVGGTYWGYSSRTNPTFVNKGARPAGISSNNSYDTTPGSSNAKNILTVGAVNTLPNGPSGSADIKIASFSSIGPTDDGRIKPDIVGDGVNVLSTGSSNVSAYSPLSGTSFATPNVSGSLLLLQEYYAQKNSGAFMRAATLKGLACHTAIDAGNAGPDYIYGWGLLNMPRATELITNNNLKSQIRENNLTQAQTQTFTVVASGDGPLSATISWTDPQGIPVADGTINSRLPKLINDLDIRVSDGTTTLLPWVLDFINPSAPATRGDNIRDNVEQVFIANATPGKTYTITVSHKGALQSGAQAYSLIVSGIGGSNYCASAAASTADSRINNVTLANINNTPVAGCTSYSDYTSQTVILEQGRTYPLSLRLGTCGNNFNKAAKVFIDWDGNGVFEPNELVATTAVINGTGIATANITVPGTVVPGNFSLMRVVLSETDDVTTIEACGTYAKGETQDYRVQFIKSNTDAGIAAIINPQTTGVCAGNGLITVTVKNFGAAAIRNIPVTVTIQAADNSITTITENYTAWLTPLQQDNFTLTTPFNFVPGATYTITATTNFSNDAITANDQAVQNTTVFATPVPANLAALLCTSTNQYLLSGQGDGTLFWYKSSTDALPFAYGPSINTTIAPTDNTYFAGLNDVSGSVGPANKGAFSGGGYNQFTPGVDVYAAVPMVIESARLYIGNSGVLTFNVTNAGGQIVATTTINATATRTTPAAGSQTDDANDQGRVYQLNLTLPAAGRYTITPVFDDKVTLYRNNAGVSGYPFKLGDLFSIIGNGATPDPPSTDTTFYKGYYYYFYDMRVKSAGCATAAKVSVTLSKPTVTQAGNVLSSNFAANNQWYLDGQPIAGANGQTYTALQSGNYQVGVTAGMGCLAMSDNYAYSLAVPKPTSDTDIGLVAFPVPVNDNLNVVFVTPAAGALTLSLVNSTGGITYSKTQNAAKGNFSTVINISGYAPGIYMLRVAVAGKIYTKKVMVMR
jgi:hypothetical protein